MHFWAKTTSDEKPGVSVFDHMRNVGMVAECIAKMHSGFLSKFGVHSNDISALAALHDIGKISPGFQRKCEAWLDENHYQKIARNYCWDSEMESDHGSVSQSVIQALLFESGVPRKSAKFLAAVLGGHHGRIKFIPNDRGYRDRLSGHISETVTGIDWECERKVAYTNIINHFESKLDLPTLSGETPLLWWLAGLTTVSDWIASDESLFPIDRDPIFETTSIHAEQTLAQINFRLPSITSSLSFNKIFTFPANELQTKVLETVTEPGVYIIEAPMGMGKTEAALGAAYQMLAQGKANGIYFALPTQATSNRIHIRLNDFVRKITSDSKSAKIIHSNSWLMDQRPSLSSSSAGSGSSQEDARVGRDWFSSSKRALLAPFGVGTVDQALLGVVAAKHFFVRHFALARKVVIIDEVHSYDFYTGTLVDKLVKTLEGLDCTVIILSATLTRARRDEILTVTHGKDQHEAEEPYPLITGRIGERSIAPIYATPPKPKEIKVDFKNVTQATEESISLADAGGTVLWICDTVDSAQQQYRRFKDQLSLSIPVGLLHSRFPFWRREQLEEEWMSRFGIGNVNRCGSILISTQIVEQSVDLDADLMISELAPTDMLLQRLGRLWRHERDLRPVSIPRLCIIEEELGYDELRESSPAEIKKMFGGKAYVYSPYVLLRTLDVWKERNSIHIPSEIRKLIETTYGDMLNEPVSWCTLRQEMLGLAESHRQIALRSSNIWSVALSDEEGIQTRLDEMPTVSVVLCRKLYSFEVEFLDGTMGKFGDDNSFHFSHAKAIHRNIVKVPRHHFIHPTAHDLFKRYLHSENTYGIVEKNGSVKVHGLKDKIKIHYSDELGLFVEKES